MGHLDAKFHAELMAVDVWTAEDVAKYLRTSSKNVRVQAARGTLPGFRIGGIWRFRRQAILDWLQHLEDAVA